MNFDINQVGALTLGVGCGALVLLVLGWTVASLFRTLWPRFQRIRTGTSVSLAVALALTATLLFRPHEDVFTGLDTSAYRLMAQSLLAGRPLHGTDTTLMEVPAKLRGNFLLASSESERKTRDRSFEITSLKSCQTRPFFYPLLPLCMVGFDAVVPGNAMDYFVPVVGFIFFAACLFAGAALGGVLGVLLAFALFLGSVLPLWLFRGCYVECVGAVLIALPLLKWAIAQDRRLDGVSCFSLGLAACFHPALMILALPAFLAFRLTSDDRAARVAGAVGAFLLGLLPVMLLTLFVCAPYGEIDAGVIARGFWNSPSQRIAACFSILFVGLLAAALFAGPRARSALSGLGRWRGACVCLVFAVVPAVAALRFWIEKEMVRAGILEMAGDVRLWLGVVLVVGSALAFVSRDEGRSRVIVTIALFTLPVFAYLKGAEPMGLWSQRRAIPTYLLLVAGILPAAAPWLGGLSLQAGLRRNAALAAAVLLMLAAAFSNIVRWPAPFLDRFERGADRWVQNVLTQVGGRLTVFDNYAFSVPPAAVGGARVLGRSEPGYGELPDVVAWLAGKAAHEDVLFASAWRNPGLEDGLALEDVGGERGDWTRARSKWGLPAVLDPQTVAVRFLKVVPLAAGAPAPALDKVMDGGPLALRGPWGRADIPIGTPDGNLPAAWSRQGSGVVGPVPPPGGSVRFTMKAVFGCANDRQKTQTLSVAPPWGSDAFDVVISNELTEAVAVVRRGRGDRSFERPTGVYRMTAAQPYDPAADGVRGFKSDLGALIHSIRIEVIGDAGR